VGATLTVRGTLFGPAEPVVLMWDGLKGRRLTTTTTTSDGSFIVRVRAPESVFGPHTVLAVDQRSGGRARATFTVHAQAWLLRRSGPPGSVNAVSATGFGAHETVALYWTTSAPRGRAGRFLLARGTTNARGSLAGVTILSFTVPVRPAGGAAIVALGARSGAMALTTFTLVPTMHINPLRGPASALVTIGGAGFRAGASLAIAWNCASRACAGPVLGKGRAGKAGTFSLAVLIPAAARAGVHTVGAVSGWLGRWASPGS